jgi:hypothetical protein
MLFWRARPRWERFVFLTLYHTHPPVVVGALQQLTSERIMEIYKLLLDEGDGEYEKTDQKTDPKASGEEA